MTGTEHALAMVPYACCYSPPHQVSRDEIYSKNNLECSYKKETKFNVPQFKTSLFIIMIIIFFLFS